MTITAVPAVMKHGRDTALGVSLRGLNDKWVYLITAVSAVKIAAIVYNQLETVN